MVKEKVGDMIGGAAEVPEDKKGEAVEATTTSIIEGLKNHFTPDNISALTSMLGHTGDNPAESSAVKDNSITQDVQSNVESSLASKVGRSQSSARRIALMVVPVVMALFVKKSGNSTGTGSGFDVGSLVKAFTGGSSSTGSGNILEKVGSFFK